ncbi:hypothetical protein BH09ACT4_BH09ACT4_07860 [soil metagenome]
MDDLKPMHNPPHPGEFISEIYLQPFEVSGQTCQHIQRAAHTRRTALRCASYLRPVCEIDMRVTTRSRRHLPAATARP